MAEEIAGKAEKEPENSQNGRTSGQYGHEETMLLAISEAHPYGDGTEEDDISR